MELVELKQSFLFDCEGSEAMKAEKSYRAIRHDVVRGLQTENADQVHHPREKLSQLDRVLSGCENKILELFAGRGNLTGKYREFGEVHAFDKKYLGSGDSFREFHRLIGEGMKYDVIDLDPYGFPNRFFPDIFLLILEGLLIVTMPKPYVNILNGITQTFLTAYFGKQNPDRQEIIEKIAVWGICHWRKVELVDSIDLGSVWRFVFKVKRVKATEYTGVRNR